MKLCIHQSQTISGQNSSENQAKDLKTKKSFDSCLVVEKEF